MSCLLIFFFLKKLFKENYQFLLIKKKYLFFFFIILLNILYPLILSFINKSFNDLNFAFIIRDLIGSITLLSIVFFYYYRNNIFKLNFFKLIIYFTGIVFIIKAAFYREFLHVKQPFYFYPEGLHWDLNINFFTNVNYLNLYLEPLIIFSGFFCIIKMIEYYKTNLNYFLLLSIPSYFYLLLLSVHVMRVNIFVTYFFVVFYFLKLYGFKNSINQIGIFICFNLTPIILFFFKIIHISNQKKYNLQLISLILCTLIVSFVCLIVYYEFDLANFYHKNFLGLNLFERFYNKLINLNFLNNRSSEYISIFFQDQILIGSGYGSTYFNESINIEVRYIHNFILYNIYKSGFIGLIFVVFVYYLFFEKFIKIIFYNIKTLDDLIYYRYQLCLMASLIYPLSFGANFKSVTFGILMSLFLIDERLDKNDKK